MFKTNQTQKESSQKYLVNLWKIGYCVMLERSGASLLTICHIASVDVNDTMAYGFHPTILVSS